MGLFKDNVFGTDALPLVLPSDLQGQAIMRFLIETNPSARPPFASVVTNITSVTMIPELSTLILFGSALLSFIVWRRL